MSRNTPDVVDNLHVRGGNSGLMGLENDAFYRQWARGKPATAPSGVTGSGSHQGPAGQALGDRGQYLASYAKSGVNEEVLDFGGASSVLSTNNLLPANSIIEFLVCTPVVEFSTPTTYDVGDASSNTRFATGLTNDGSSSLTGPQYAKAHWAGTVAIVQASAGKVKLTPNAAGTGKVHVAVYYRQFVGGQQ